MRDPNLAPEVADPLAFSVSEVTGLRTLEIENVDGHREAGQVAMSMASLLGLPTNTPYGLRDDASARMLADDQPLGGKIPSAGTKLVVIPKSHLG
jgi:hypothetical protein